MSRSRRHSPFVGWTTAESDKPWKCEAARRLRRAFRRYVANADGPMPSAKGYELTNPFSSLKDGKQRIADTESPFLRK